MILTQDQIDDLKKGLTTDSDFSAAKKVRFSEYKEQTVKTKYLDHYLKDPDEKWVLIKKNKIESRIGVKKASDHAFEDKVWKLFSLMGYKFLNKDRSWSLPFGKQKGESKQIDVFAVNDETIVFVECKHTDEVGKMSSLKTDLESYQNNIGKLVTAAKELFPDKKLKHKFILATNNYKLSSTDKTRVDTLNGIHMSEENINYFFDLYENIGEAAMYQFAGFLFEGLTIPELPNVIPAIKAKMGGITYYSFSIEPATLLKISYVLHRNKANKGQMETYQRLVKGKRLKEIKKFIDTEEGYFPNSIILNLKSNGKLQFDLASQKSDDFSSRIGYLHLPSQYKSAQIIDGQHRLLAYAGSRFATTHAIPVVAFENLDAKEQIKLFMQINQNQKPVDKSLKNTLNSILYSNSDIRQNRIEGMRLKVAEDLANDSQSALFGFVSSGVDDAKITSNFIEKGLNMDVFLGKIKKNDIIQTGVFYKGGDEDSAYLQYKKFVFCMVEMLVNEVAEVQQPNEEGLILNNRGIYAYFRLIGDILQLLIQQGENLDKVDDIITKVKPYLDPLFKFFNTKIKDNDEETVNSLKLSYGGGGEARYLRTYQRVVKETRNDFDPQGLEDYWNKFSQSRVSEAKAILEELENTIREDIVQTLTDEFGSSWFAKGVPTQTAKDLASKEIDYNSNHPDNLVQKDALIEFLDCFEIILQNWNLLKGTYADSSITGDRKNKIEWIKKLATIKHDIQLKPFIDTPNFDFVKEMKKLYITQE